MTTRTTSSATIKLPNLLNTAIKKVARNLFGLSAATTLGYLVSMALLPFLARAYTPEAFGRFALIWGLTQVLGLASTLRYEKALFLAKSRLDFHALSQLSLALCALSGFAIFATVAIVVSAGVAPPVFFLLPISAASQGLFLLEQAKSNVSNKYLNTGLARGAQPALGSFFALILANGSTSGHGLLIGLTLSLLLCAFGLRFATNQGNRITDLPNPSLSDLRSVAGKYSNFARFTMPHETFAAVSSRVAVVLIPMYFGSAIAGFFFMAQKFATIPSLLISSSASQVYFHETAAKINRLETPRPVFIAALTTAALASISIYIVAVLALPRLIPLLLGPGWERSIAFTHLLLPWAAINFIGSILSQTPQALGKQQTAMLCEIANGTLRIAGLTLGFFLNNPSFGLILFLASGALFSIGRILWYSRLTKEFKPTVAAP